MSAPLVRIHIQDHAATVILNRPEKRNALTRALLANLAQALADLHLEKKVRSIILTGAGPVFCAGMDLAEMAETRHSPDAHGLWREDATVYRDLLETMLRFPKPLIAALNGPAVAGGAGLALACDLVIAAETATFALPEPLRGIVAGMVAPLLAFRIGGGQAARLLMTGMSIDAAEARRVGLFHEVLHPDHLWPRASILAQECAKCAPQALQLTKQVLNETVGEQVFTQLGAGAAASAAARTTDAAVEGLNAFLEKRPPRWD